MWQAVAVQPFDISRKHKAPRRPDGTLDEFWLENPFDFENTGGFNLSRFERNRMFFNLGDGGFREVSFLSGTDIDSDTRGVAIGDLDDDARPDMIVRNVGGGPVRVFRNAMEGRGVRVRLRGTASNKQGIGARLWLTQGDRTTYREHFPQNTLNAQHATESIFAILAGKGAASMRIRWPSGHEQTLQDVQPGLLEVTEAK